MKTMYVPKGTIMRHDNITEDVLVVEGHLIVEGTIRVKKICGTGSIEAEKIIAHEIKTDVLDVTTIHAKKVIANKVYCYTARISNSLIVNDFIEARNVTTHTIAMTQSSIEMLDASEIIRLKPKKRSFIGMLLSAWVKERFSLWRHNQAIQKSAEMTKVDKGSEPKAYSNPETEKTLEAYKEMCSAGHSADYRLVLEPIDKAAEKRFKVV